MYHVYQRLISNLSKKLDYYFLTNNCMRDQIKESLLYQIRMV